MYIGYNVLFLAHRGLFYHSARMRYMHFCRWEVFGAC